MAGQYGRNCKITIADKPDIDVGKAFDFSGLRVKFEIYKDVNDIANRCRLEVFNLSRSSRGRIKEALQEVLIETGYGDDIGVAFKGDIRNVFHRRNRTDIITEIYAGAGDRWTGFSAANTTTGAGRSLDALVRLFAARFVDKFGKKVAIGEINLSNATTTISGATYTSSVADALNQLADTYDFNWFIEDGAFNALSGDRYFEKKRITRISSKTGMIESPVVTEVGIDLKTYMNRDIAPGRIIKVESTGQQVNLGNLYFAKVPETIGAGEYKVLRVLHTGDTRGNDWFSEMEAMRMSLVGEPNE